MTVAEPLYEKTHGAADLIVQGKHTCFLVHRQVVLKASRVLQDEYAKIVTSATEDATLPLIKLEGLEDLTLRRMLDFLYVGDYVDALSEEAEPSVNNELEWLHLHAKLHFTTDVPDLKDLAAAYFCDVIERTSYPQVYLEAAKLAYISEDSSHLLRHVLVSAVWNLPKLLRDERFRQTLATDSALQRFGFDLLHYSFRLSLLRQPKTAWDKHVRQSAMNERYDGLKLPDDLTTSLPAEEMQLEHAREAAEKEIDRLRRENTSLMINIDSLLQEIVQPKRVDRKVQALYESLVNPLEDLRHGDTWIIETLTKRLLLSQDTSALLLDVVRSWKEVGELALANNKTLIRELAELSGKVISMSREPGKSFVQSSDLHFALMLQIAQLKQDKEAAQNTIGELRSSADAIKHAESSLTKFKHANSPTEATSQLRQTSIPLVHDSEEQKVDSAELERRLQFHFEAAARIDEEIKRLPGHDLPPKRVPEKLQAEPVEAKNHFTSAKRNVDETEQYSETIPHPDLASEQHEAGHVESSERSDLESRSKALPMGMRRIRETKGLLEVGVKEHKTTAKELDQNFSSEEFAGLTEEVKRLRDTKVRLDNDANKCNSLAKEVDQGNDSKDSARLTLENDQLRASITRLETELNEQKSLARESKERTASQNNELSRVRAERDQFRTNSDQLRSGLAKQKAAVAESERLGSQITKLEQSLAHCNDAATSDRATIARLEKTLKAQDTNATEPIRSITWYTKEVARLTKEVACLTTKVARLTKENACATQSRDQLRSDNAELQERIADQDDDMEEAEAIRLYVLQLITHPQKCLVCGKELSMYDLERDNDEGTLGIWLRCSRCRAARIPRPMI